MGLALDRNIELDRRLEKYVTLDTLKEMCIRDRILLVEDDKIIVASLSEYLNSEGYLVRRLSGQAAAMKLLAAVSYTHLDVYKRQIYVNPIISSDAL